MTNMIITSKKNFNISHLKEKKNPAHSSSPHPAHLLQREGTLDKQSIVSRHVTLKNVLSLRNVASGDMWQICFFLDALYNITSRVI